MPLDFTRRVTRRQFLWCSAAGLALGRGTTAAQPITGMDNPYLAPFDEMMTAFVREQRVPGAALAVTRGKRLVYARGFGYADRDRQTPVEPDALFRIASVSKPFTAVAVIRLVEQGKFRLADRVTDLIHVEPFLPNGGRPDSRLKDVTVLHLLQHTAGWDRDLSPDPMFLSVEIANALGVPPPAKQEHIIRYVFGRPLDFDPGSRYCYSNFGYCLLGEVIRQVTGQSYEEFVRREVLEPVGIRRMRLGRSLEQAPGEVRYYDDKQRTGPAVVGRVGESVPWPYGTFYLEAMDAHGGWIASAVDLVRFAAAFDDPRRCPLLKPASIATMYARPAGRAGSEEGGKPTEVYYGCGWSIRILAGRGEGNVWHSGTLEGSSAELVRRHDGLNWAMLFNSRNGPSGKPLPEILDPLVHDAADRVRVWPRHDLFGKG